MGFSDRILGRKSNNGGPRIETVSPSAAITGGEIRISGSGLRPQELQRPKVRFGDVEGSLVVSSDAFLIARVPEGATSGPVVVATDGHVSNSETVHVAVPIIEALHPVTNPALDAEGNIYATYSGQRGQKVPVAIYRIDVNYNIKPFVPDLMNPTGLAFDSEGYLYLTDRKAFISSCGLNVSTTERRAIKQFSVGYTIQRATARQRQIFMRHAAVQPVQQMKEHLFEAVLQRERQVHVPLRDLRVRFAWLAESLLHALGEMARKAHRAVR